MSEEPVRRPPLMALEGVTGKEGREHGQRARQRVTAWLRSSSGDTANRTPGGDGSGPANGAAPRFLRC